MMNTVAIIVVVLWLLGWWMSIGGAWIHVLLVVAVVLFAMGMFGKKAGGSTSGGTPPTGGQPTV